MDASLFVVLSFFLVFDGRIRESACQTATTSCETDVFGNIIEATTAVGPSDKKSKKNKWKQFEPSSKINNPNFIKDRHKGEINKPELPYTWANRHKQPYNPSWMDYCDPYHCNDYHKQACGLNRRQLKYKWFQSACHISLANRCARYRGHLQYDIVETKFCHIYLMYLRTGCPHYCEDDVNAICAIDSNNKAAIFVNRCALEMENCQRSYGYEEVKMSICDYYLNRGAAIVPTYIS